MSFGSSGRYLSNQIFFSASAYSLPFKKEERIIELLKDISDERNLNDERVLCYAQPIFDVDNKSFRTAEALMRIQYKDQIITPDKFIGLAEKYGYIHSLTCIMLNKVCLAIKDFEKNGYDFDGITINCSAIEFSSKNLYKQLFKIIYDNKIDIRHIRIELTESAIVTSSNNVIDNMSKLSAAGVVFYLDDFGTGYSNFERMMEFPFNIIEYDWRIAD